MNSVVRNIFLLAALFVAVNLYFGIDLETPKNVHSEPSTTNGVKHKTWKSPLKHYGKAKSSIKNEPTIQKPEEMACRLPGLKPFDPSVKKFISDPGPHRCTSRRHQLIFKTDLESNLLTVGNAKTRKYSKCCYQSFRRKSPGLDSSIVLDSKCHLINKTKMKIRKEVEFIRVNCKKRIKGTSKSVPVDFFGFVHLKPEVEAKLKKRIKKLERGRNTTRERSVNVVILGVDAVSHMNFQRVMPKTRDYLVKNLSAYYLDGYTKTGENTFPNLVPALMGQSVEEIQKGCWKSRSDPIDACPFIWKNFKAQGYRTAYGEDAVRMGNFNYAKRGFNKIPTDYYYNGLVYQMEAKIGHKYAKVCHGPRLSMLVHLDYLQKMAVTMNKTRRYFQLSWATALTHDWLMQGKQGDQPLLDTLKWFKDEGYLEDTVFILMSDHGMRYGGIRSTIQGQYESSMPFAYFILPEWFQEKYRPAVRNLLQNRKKLTTPFDLHETLLDLSHLESISVQSLKNRSEMLKKRKNLSRGISFFLPIPPSRTCKDASIPEQYCVCRQLLPVELKGNTLIQEGARYVVHVLNGLFVKFPQCSPLVLDRLLNAHQVLQSNNNAKLADFSANITRAEDPRLRRQEVSFSISFLVRPSNGSFESTTTRHTNGSWDVHGEISRTNLYVNQSRCVADYELKKFCYCG